MYATMGAIARTKEYVRCLSERKIVASTKRWMSELLGHTVEARCDHDADLLTLKRILVCQICSELMFTPFVMSCGHTFCYGCSNEWLKSRKTCPTCRNKISRKPVTCYPLKEMACFLAERQEGPSLCGDVRSLRDMKIEQESLLQSHGTSFPDLFAEMSNIHGNRLEDLEDHVIRCARCQWEVEGPECT